MPVICGDWKIGRVKDLFYLSKEFSTKENSTILSLARSAVKVRDISNNEGQIAASYDNYNSVQIGDLLLNPMDLYSGANCNVSYVEGVISPAYSNLRAKVQLEPRFYDFYFKVQYWTMAMFAHGKGVSFENRWTLNNESLLSYEVPIPTYEEQKKIVEVLDKKLSQIEDLITLQEKQIEKINEYKESLITNVILNGLDKSEKVECDLGYANSIVKGYNALKLEQVAKVITDYVASGSFESLATNVTYLDSPDYAMLIRTADVSNKKDVKPVYVSQHSYEFLSNSNLFGGELMFPNIGASCGDVYIVPKLYEKMTLAPNAIMMKTNYNDKYYFYYFQTKNMHEHIIQLATNSSAQPKFNKTVFRAIRVAVPDIEEQNKIADYLDEKCFSISKLIEIKNRKIEELQDYKKSLIYEYVIGKKQAS